MSVESVIMEIEGIVESELNRIAGEIEADLKAAANKDTGRMAGSIHAQRTGKYSYFIGTSITDDKGFPYPVVANDGRGPVKPVRRDGRGPVKHVRRKVLKFKDGSYHPYARSYGGSHFVENVASRYK